MVSEVVSRLYREESGRILARASFRTLIEEEESMLGQAA